MIARIRPCRDDDRDLAAYVAIVAAVDPSEPTSLEEIRWGDATYPGGLRLLAEDDGVVVGCASVGRVYVYPAEYERAWLSICVLPAARRRGTGTALWAALSDHARAMGKTGFDTSVDETATDALAFLEHRGFTETDRSRMVRLSLAGLDPPTPTVPSGIRLATLADRPDLLPGVHAVAVAAFPDIPWDEVPMSAGDLAEFRARDVDRPGIPHDAFVVAVEEASDEVVGYASLMRIPGSETRAWHDMTAVHPRARGRGIALALKTATIRWAVEQGLEALETGNDVGNAPMRAVNARLGYVPLPDRIGYSGPFHPALPDPP